MIEEMHHGYTFSYGNIVTFDFKCIKIPVMEISSIGPRFCDTISFCSLTATMGYALSPGSFRLTTRWQRGIFDWLCIPTAVINGMKNIQRLFHSLFRRRIGSYKRTWRKKFWSGHHLTSRTCRNWLYIYVTIMPDSYYDACRFSVHFWLPRTKADASFCGPSLQHLQKALFSVSWSAAVGVHLGRVFSLDSSLDEPPGTASMLLSGLICH